ncbi:Tetraspannin-domain-containing protein [Gigaspora margarita]|uniref:Tetraspannin-domain-containing protein n=1 Tax=Gigaspora margarita TaxID=4874 RepID=A0A8H4ETT6_GIGMA|nr:Tetraspannin-domain-containing protein [Gigaspora margarita]
MGVSVEAGRIIVILTNTLTTIVGLILIVLGLYELASPEVSLYSNAIPLATIIFGIAILLISITGCCGGLAENKPILWAYFIVLLLLIVLQIIAAIITLADTQNVEKVLDTWWQVAYNDNPRIIRDIEDKYSCCGFSNVTDRAVPKKSPDACTKSSWFGYDKPCLQVLTSAYKHHQIAIGAWGIILAFIQILALIAAYVLLVNLPTPEQRDRDYRTEHERLIKMGRNVDPDQQQSKPYYTDRGTGVSGGSSGAARDQYGSINP